MEGLAWSSGVAEILALATALLWVALTLDRSRSWPAELRLPAAAGDGATPGRDSVVAVVPARNEAGMLALTLPPLLAQDGLAGIVLVDDGSDDGTAEVGREIAAAAGRTDLVRVVRAAPTPPGWAGKVWALARGLEALRDDPELARSRWLLLTDADVEHRPGSVAALLGKAREGHDLVSVMARLHVRSVWERLLVPAFVYFFQLLYPFRKVSSPASPTAAAAGGCVLVRRDALERAGGFTSIRGAVIDDVALARVVAGAGGRLWLGLDPGIRSRRPYPRLADLWRMVARSAFDQLGYRYDLLVLVLAGLGLFFVAPPILLGVGAAGIVSEEPGAWRTALGAAVALGLQVRALLPAVRHHGLGAPWAALLPLSSLCFAAMTLSSAVAHLTGRGVLWRGRKVGGAPVRG